MRLLRLYIALLLSSTFFYACSDFEETDLSEETVVLLAPGDCTTNDENSQLFVWEDLTEDDPDLDVEYYNLQIAEPSFFSPLRFILDSNVIGTSYEIAIEPGEYQWRVRAENSSSRSSYTTNNLTVDSSFNLTNANLFLSSPVNNSTINVVNSAGKTVSFEWIPLAGADEYTFLLVYGTIDNVKVSLSEQQTTTKTKVDAEVYREKVINGVTVGAGDYEWQVIAKNLKTNTTTSSKFRFTVDTTSTGN